MFKDALCRHVSFPLLCFICSQISRIKKSLILSGWKLHCTACVLGWVIPAESNAALGGALHSECNVADAPLRQRAALLSNEAESLDPRRRAVHFRFNFFPCSIVLAARWR